MLGGILSHRRDGDAMHQITSQDVEEGAIADGQLLMWEQWLFLSLDLPGRVVSHISAKAC